MKTTSPSATALACIFVLASATGCTAGGDGERDQLDGGPPPACDEVPGTRGDGETCQCNEDCMAGAICSLEGVSGWPGGYCTRLCDGSPADECGPGTFCGVEDHDITLCLVSCAATADCPPGRACNGAYCSPLCWLDSQCASGHCDLYTARCVHGEPAHDSGGLLVPCLRPEDCNSRACSADHGTCHTACSVAEQGCPEEGVCIPRGLARDRNDVGMCTLRCGDTDDCPPDFACGYPETVRAERVCIHEYLPVCLTSEGEQSDGAPCTCDADCGVGALCSLETGDSYPEGRCFRECTALGECNAGAFCSEDNVCKLSCRTDADCPRASDLCVGTRDISGAGVSTCFAICQADSDCPGTGFCNRHRGRCEEEGSATGLGLYAPCGRDDECLSDICFDGFCGSLCSVVRQGCPDDGVCVGSSSDNMGICYLPCGPGGECDHGLTCTTPGSLPPGVTGVCM